MNALLRYAWSLLGTWWVFAAFTIATLVLLWLAIAGGLR
jgi:ABC-type multidrug transport system permease subunit